MTSDTTTTTTTLQSQSPLLCIPGELRNAIYTFCQLSSCTITNPSFDKIILPKHQDVPVLGIALARTCRNVNTEFDYTPLYTSHEFVFTRVAHIHAFFSRLSRERARLIRGITIDLREAASGYPNDRGAERAGIVANEWVHYLSCNHFAHPLGAWCSSLSTLESDIPEVRALTIDLTGWQSPFAGTRKAGWKYLRSLLGRLRGLESLTLKGNCLDSTCWNPTPLPWALSPWFSPAFGDESALVDLMGGAVQENIGQDWRKLFEWSVVNQTTTLVVRVGDDRDKRRLSGDGESNVLTSGIITWDGMLDFRTNRDEAAGLSKKLVPHPILMYGNNVLLRA